jgi:AcrR family transcriptional regulator
MSNRRARPSIDSKTNGAAVASDHPGSPWRATRERLRDREVKREAVIRAAAHAFNIKGYHNTSLDDIAAALDVSKPTVYYYVANKEQLLFECFVAGIEQIRAAFRQVKNLDVSARERLNEVLRNYAKAMASEFGWCMVRVEDQDLSPAMSAHIKTLKSEIDHGIRRMIRDGVQDGSIHPCDPKMTAFALAGSLNWIAHWYRENRSLTAAQIAEAFITVFDNGLQPRSTAASSRQQRSTTVRGSRTRVAKRNETKPRTGTNRVAR